jgi:hypothetical protein
MTSFHSHSRSVCFIRLSYAVRATLNSCARFVARKISQGFCGISDPPLHHTDSLAVGHFGRPLDNFLFGFAEISPDEFKDFVATGASDEEVAKWIERKAKRRPRIEIIKWNNDWRYKRLSEMPDAIQEFMEDYVPQFVPAHLRHHIDYFFDVYDAEEQRIGP